MSYAAREEEDEVKTVIIGAGSVAFTPAIPSGFGVDKRYRAGERLVNELIEAQLQYLPRFR